MSRGPGSSSPSGSIPGMPAPVVPAVTASKARMMVLLFIVTALALACVADLVRLRGLPHPDDRSHMEPERVHLRRLRWSSAAKNAVP